MVHVFSGSCTLKGLGRPGWWAQDSRSPGLDRGISHEATPLGRFRTPSHAVDTANPENPYVTGPVPGQGFGY